MALLPACGIFSQTLFTAFARESTVHRFWATEEFWFFSLGGLLWLITFFGLPRPVLLYVFGHELTHALWVWLLGGRVRAFKVGRTGGYIIADTNNVAISLAPYFFPLYSVGVLLVWAGLQLGGLELAPYRQWLFALVGASWGFHLTFTCWMILKGQPDLKLHGTFFSLVVIYLANLLVLAALFLLACPQVGWADFAAALRDNALGSWAAASEAVAAP